MKNSKINIFRQTSLLLTSIVIAVFLVGCVGDELFRDELPDSNSKEDLKGPEANFSYASTLEDFRTINFSNLSNESTTYLWDFGGGNTSTEQNPTFTFEDGEGTYPVTLTASDALNAIGTITIDVIVVEGPFQPIILEPGFEDDTLPGGGGDGRDSWRNNDLGGVIQITGSPVTFGDQGAKLPTPAGDRIGYQEITVEPDTNYDLRFYYTMLNNATDPWLTVAVLGVTEHGSPTNTQEVLDATIASKTVNDTEDPSVYIQETLAFNSGVNNTVAIYFTNGPVECRLDDFTIDVGADGAVPPSAGFSSEQSEINYLEYTFSNTSTGATSYLWDFGDGNTSTEESPTHVYDVHNTYTVTLTATNDANLSTTLTQTIDIQAPVTADFTYEVDPNNYRTYSFMDASEDAVMLLWEFGDGFQFTGMNPSHTYAEDGIYTVTLTATSVTGSMSVASAELVVSQGFVVQVLNGTFDLYGTTVGCDGESTGDNADAWDMTPNSTIKDCDGNNIPSPYDPLWDNGALDSWLDSFYGDDSEQAGSTSEGNNGTRGAKLDEAGRRLYQVVTVQQGESYTFSIDVKGDSDGLTPEVFLLNTEIQDEIGINASTSDAAVDAYSQIAATTSYETYSFDFTASSGQIVIYVRNVVGSVRIDNITIQ
ncbi:PKD domain-containing protein [Winogradskyella echinorum]|uniref:PKD domain-containing protein n=1 Tax=Winogradskyella echinorum TaxID=538189 RepID=A0ABR6XWD5_9FLAO|nr:PKD domain-containing protein [Winogradskyella echinorum]MBC3844787.1 PKD domain-containing protein [Winogradskyella echinorum]MBC5749135.1 PKD domain-containing protein [Winogradskyella echinorum]